MPKQPTLKRPMLMAELQLERQSFRHLEVLHAVVHGLDHGIPDAPIVYGKDALSGYLNDDDLDTLLHLVDTAMSKATQTLSKHEKAFLRNRPPMVA